MLCCVGLVLLCVVLFCLGVVSCVLLSCVLLSSLVLFCLIRNRISNTRISAPIPQPAPPSLYRDLVCGQLSARLCALSVIFVSVSFLIRCLCVFPFLPPFFGKQQSSASFRDGEKVDAKKYLPPESRTIFFFPAPLRCLSLIGFYLPIFNLYRRWDSQRNNWQNYKTNVEKWGDENGTGYLFLPIFLHTTTHYIYT